MEPESSSNNSLLRLPRKIRDDIYRRVLIVPHPLYLFKDGAVHKVELFAPDRPARWPTLLYINRIIHDEAIEILYRSHQFVLVDTGRSQATLLETFLDLIGSVNAGYLSHICINFPVAATDLQRAAGHKVGPEDVTGILLDEDLHGLKLIQQRCRNLTTLEMYVHSENSQGLVASAGQGEMSRHTNEALAEVEAQLKAIASLKKVIVRLYNGPLNREVAEVMQSFGWAVLSGR